MPHASEQKEQVDDALMESLLTEVFQPDSIHDAERFARLMGRLDNGVTVQLPEKLVWYRRRSWMGFAATAAAILVGIFLLNYSINNNAAYAAVIRSLTATPAKRFYQVKMLQQFPLWGERQIKAELYLDDNDRFVVKHPGWAGVGPIWIGGNPVELWIVPFRGPALVGGERTVGRWLDKKDIPSPYLHVSTILHRMSRAYSLEMLPNEKVPANESPDRWIECQHIRGTIKQPKSNLPVTIELWADTESGIAQRLTLIWNRSPDERGPLKWELELAQTPNLPDNWFSPEGHLRANSRIMRVQSETELESLAPADQ